MSDERIQKTRVNLYLPEELRLWVWEQANKQGFNFTTMVQVMIMDYRKQANALDMSKIGELLIGAQREKEYENNNPN